MQRSIGVAVFVLSAFVARGTASAREVAELTVTSPAFQNNGFIPAQFTCEGDQSSPPLTWSAPPPDTRSIVVIVDDPDAPSSVFEHLVVYNLPPDERSLPPQPARHVANLRGIPAQNSNRDLGWAPICPPKGLHHYRFIVVGLDTLLQLPRNASSREVDLAMRGHIIARGQLVGTFERGRVAAPPQSVHPLIFRK